MPLTPFHALSVLWLSFKREKYFDPISIIISSMILDLEPFLVLVLNLPYLTHGFWHSYFACFVVSLLLTPFLHFFEARCKGVVVGICRFSMIKFHGFPYSFKFIFLNCLFGTSFHVFLDSFTHGNFPYVLFPFYVFSRHSNPFWLGMNVAITIELIVIGLSLLSLGLWLKGVASAED